MDGLGDFWKGRLKNFVENRVDDLVIVGSLMAFAHG